MMIQYKSPIAIYVVSHPDCETSLSISHQLFGKLCRDIDRPFSYRLGLPVFFRATSARHGRPPEIDFDTSQKFLLICLIGTKVLLDPKFREYVIDLFTQTKSKENVMLLPIALSDSAHRIDPEIGKLNFIGAAKSEFPGHIDKFHYIYHFVLHELCRLLLSSDEGVHQPELVKLFISHSKHDDTLDKAKTFRDYINSNTQLKTFFDANDISYGGDFAKIIKDNAGNCIVVAFLSDTYSAREWCRNEVIVAKENHCPMIIVDAVSSGENRSFPYLGNTPTIRWDGDNQAISNLALETTLRSYYVNQSLKNQAEFYQVPYDFILSGYPELFSIIGIKEKLSSENKDAGIIIYPDPPLGNEELRLLNKMDDRLTFITPLQLNSFLHE